MSYVRPVQGLLEGRQKQKENEKKKKGRGEGKKQKRETLTAPLRYQVRTDMNDGAKLTGGYHTQHGW